MPNPIRTHTIFDGHDLEALGIVVELVHDPMPQMREDTEPRAGRDGSYLKDLHVDMREITLDCRGFKDRWESFDELKDALSAVLVTDSDRRLYLRTHPSQYYMAHYVSFEEGDRIGGTGIGEFGLTFHATDPIRYGESRSQVVKAGETKTVTVGGTHPADLVVSSNNARAGSSGYWAVVVNGRRMSVAMSKTANSKVSIDCKNHSVSVNGKAAMLTLDSDWPVMSPGKRTAKRSDGSGSATLSWIQRYV